MFPQRIMVLCILITKNLFARFTFSLVAAGMVCGMVLPLPTIGNNRNLSLLGC